MGAQANVAPQPVLVRTKDGGVFVPSSTDFLTTYVLLEQEDWFEKEMGFVRTALQPGMRVIDVGANYGVYMLAMARAVAPDGSVWAFEPADETLKFLRNTAAANSLGNVTICPMALSDHEGFGFLDLQRNSELNALVAVSTASSQRVRLATLDSQHTALAMGRIDFIKLDAEGEEVRILLGSRRFFEEQSPLVMFELKAGDKINFELPQAFHELGYQIYRLVGPDVLLVPVADEEIFDAYELNLFACKADRARLLAGRGLLAEESAPAPSRVSGAGLAFWRRQPFASAWPLVDTGADSAWADYYASWRDTSLAPASRFAALQVAIKALTETGAANDLAGSANRARLLLEAGARQAAMQAIGQCLAGANQGAELGGGIVWPPSRRYDAIAPVGPAREWLLASAVQAHADTAYFSDYFSRSNFLTALDWLQSTPYANAPIERRRQLQSIRAGRQTGLVPSKLLDTAGPEHLNPALWGGR
jgi:FkbM family methyltransferase